MEREIRENLAEYDIPVLTLIAPQGNINHFDVSTESGQTCYAEAVRIGKGYAAAVLAALYRLSPVEVDRITYASCEMEAPYITVSDAEYAEAAQIVETYKDAVMDKDRDLTSEDIARKNPFVMKMFAQNLLDCRDKAIREKRFERLVAIGLGRKVGIISMPGEPFCEIGRAIRGKLGLSVDDGRRARPGEHWLCRAARQLPACPCLRNRAVSGKTRPRGRDRID